MYTATSLFVLAYYKYISCILVMHKTNEKIICYHREFWLDLNLNNFFFNRQIYFIYIRTAVLNDLLLSHCSDSNYVPAWEHKSYFQTPKLSLEPCLGNCSVGWDDFLLFGRVGWFSTAQQGGMISYCSVVWDDFLLFSSVGWFSTVQ